MPHRNVLPQADLEIGAAKPDWYRDAVIYELHVRAFADGNGDGKGDFEGLIGKLPYLRDLGVDCLWLLPFYPSPLRDDGYDIADYCTVHPDYGTLSDFRRFLKEAHRLGMKVITELVVNHTSDRHPWFQRARQASPGSSDRNWYVWSDTQDRWPEARIIFTDTETSNWTWDPVAGQYFWHRFFSHQPDLNFDHPPVAQAIEKVLRFWLDLGVDGMRLDAIPYLFERDGTNCENLPETHGLLRRLRAVMDEYQPPRMFLAEANQWPEDVRAYFGDGDECHMAYHFPLMPRLFMALAQEDRHPIVEIMRRTPAIPEGCQWALFLRNHDELTLEMVTDKERDYMLRAYAANPRMRVNVGIRRRLSPLLENSRPRIELLTALLLSMPGTPVLYYGDEIGMGDNIWLGDRNGVRTPMQWSADRNAGFSRCDPSSLFAPVIQDPLWHYSAINVENQERDPSSLLAWTRRMLHLRHSLPIFGRGSLEFLEPSNRRVLAYLRRHEGETLLVVANLSRHPQPFSLDLSGLEGMVPVEMQGNVPFPRIGKEPWNLSLGPWGWMWFRLRSSDHPVRHLVSDLPILVQEDEGPWWEDRNLCAELESSLIPGWIHGCSWVRAQAAGIRAVGSIRFDALHGGLVLASIAVEFDDGHERCFRVPLLDVAESEAQEGLFQGSQELLCRVRRPDGSMVVIVEALAFSSGLISLEHALQDAEPGVLEVRRHASSPGEGSLRGASLMAKERVAGLPSGTVLKWYHAAGPSAARSRTRLAALAEAGFSSAPSLLGEVREARTGETLGILMPWLENQGSLEDRLTHELVLFLESARYRNVPVAEAMLPTLALIEELGRSVGSLHAAMPDRGGWSIRKRAAFLGSLRDLLLRLARRVHPRRRLAQQALQDRIWSQVAEWNAAISLDSWSGSAHGDLHLGQILLRDGGLAFLDFDGNETDPQLEFPDLYDDVSLRESFFSLEAVTAGDAAALELVARWKESAWQGYLQARSEPRLDSLAFVNLLKLRRRAEALYRSLVSFPEPAFLHELGLDALPSSKETP